MTAKEEFAKKFGITHPFVLSQKSRCDECSFWRENYEPGTQCAEGHQPRFYKRGMLKPGCMRVCEDFDPINPPEGAIVHPI
jgi:hypothetical protein